MESRARSGRLKFKEVKRRRMMISSDSEEPEVRKGVGREGSLSSKSNEFDDHHVECGKDEVNWIGKKRKLDVFEFDEYDRFDADLMLKKHCGIDGQGNVDEGKSVRRPSDAQQADSEAGTSGGKVIVYKRRSSFKSDSDRSISPRNKRTGRSMNRNADSFFSSKRPNASLESIRFQGGNGVLKVHVNKTKGSNPIRTRSRLEAEDYETSIDGCVVVRNKLENSSSVVQATFDQQSVTVGRTGRAFLNLHKSVSAKTGHKKDSDFEDSDTSSKPGKYFDSNKSVSRKQCKGDTATPAPSKNARAVSGSEYANGKLRGRTEKQKLREHIKKMLLDAGWTIDYRPRRNRGYNDAVYVNTSGTSYWSIIKAYDALQKETSDKNERITSLEDSSFTPLPENILCKLTRSTQQKMKKVKKVQCRKSGRIVRLNQALSRSSKGNSESEETTSGEDEEDYEEEEEEGLSPLNKKSVRSVKVGNGSENSKLHLQARKNKKLGKCTLLVRSANKGMNPSDGYVPYTGKRTLLSWLIDCGTVKVSEKIRYMNSPRKRLLQQGWITRDGIHCVCCSKIVSVAKFEIHAGSKLRQSLQNIITESGVSLSQCLFDAWNQKAESDRNYFHNVDVDGDDPNDDTCSICGDGGDLICCDGCPSTFHQNCLGIEVLPAGDWHCPQCICLHCRTMGNTNVDSDTSKISLQRCTLCEMKYHISCLKEVDSYAEDSSCYSFCGTKCEELHKILQESVGVRIELEEGFSWSLIRRTIIDSDHSGDRTPQKLECNVKLAIAQTIMDECFLPINDRRSQVNLINNVLYNCGSNFNRLNYRGFYTAILEKEDEVISAASLRFHGTQFAEMPFIGTRHIYRRQGMCRRLFSAIESALRSYKVEKLVIPAISELLHTWIDVFGFHHLTQFDKEKLRSFNMMVFPGVDMLQKVLVGKDRLEDEPVVITGSFNMNELASDLLCQKTGALISHLDDHELACSEPGGVVENTIESSCFPNENNEVCDDDCVVPVKRVSSPDLSRYSDGPCREKLLYDEDENKAPELKSEEIKTVSKTKWSSPTYCSVADANMESGHMSESFAGESNGRVELFPSDNSGILIACTDKKSVSRSLELFTPPLREDRQSLVEEVISITPTFPDMVSEENSSDITASATKFSTSSIPLHISNSDMSMEDAEVQKTTCGRPSKERDSHVASSPISTAHTTVSCIVRDEDVDMNPPAYADTSTFSSSDIIIGQ